MTDTKMLFIEKALSLFIRDGFSGVSLANILKETGLSKGSFYYYFASKEICFEECVKFFLSGAAAAEPSEDTPSLWVYIDFAVKAVAQRVDTYRSIDRVRFYGEAMKIIPGLGDYIRSNVERELNSWAQAIQAAIDSGEIKGNIPALDAAKLFVYQCDGIMLNSSLGNGSVDFDIEVEKAWNAIYGLLKGS